jgi:hypothetical protein
VFVTLRLVLVAAATLVLVPSFMLMVVAMAAYVAKALVVLSALALVQLVLLVEMAIRALSALWLAASATTVARVLPGCVAPAVRLEAQSAAADVDLFLEHQTRISLIVKDLMVKILRKRT